MHKEQDSRLALEDESTLYDYFQILMKRKKLFISIFLYPLFIVSAISAILPSYYRAEGEIKVPVVADGNAALANTSPNNAAPSYIIIPVMTATNIVNMLGEVDNEKKNLIFKNNPDDIKNVSIFLPKKSSDTIKIVLETKTIESISPAFNDLFEYVLNLPEIRNEIARKQAESDLRQNKLISEVQLRLKRRIEEIDLQLPKLIKARKANLVFLNQIMNQIHNGEQVEAQHNPAEILEKDADLSSRIMNLANEKKDLAQKRKMNNSTLLELNLQTEKLSIGVLSSPSITKQRTTAQLTEKIIITCVLSLFAGIFVIFLLEYFERMKARKMR